MKNKEFVKMLNSFPQSDVELADLLYVSKPTIARWREGQNLPAHRLRKALLEVLENA